MTEGTRGTPRRYVMSRRPPRYPGQFGDAVAEVETETSRVPLEHHVRHSPDGFEWGYAGSGPSELARCILFDALGEAPDPAVYQEFKSRFIAETGREDGFEIDGSTVDAFLALAEEAP